MDDSNSFNPEMKSKHPSLIICGTDTDVGKTVVSALLVQGLNATYWKPIQSGLENNGDTGRIRHILNLSKERWIPEAYKFHAAVSPHWAAEKEHRLINFQELKIPEVDNTLIVETAGGLMVPLNRQYLQIDQLKSWNCPVILVARTGLGTLNHTLLSLEALRHREIPILGLFLNGDIHMDNPKTLQEFGHVNIIGQLPLMNKINLQTLSEQWEKQGLSMTFQKLLQPLIN